MSIDKLSPHFTLAEALFSVSAQKHKIDNSPGTEDLKNIKFTAERMEEVRRVLDSKQILVSSWYRSYALNKVVGGAQTSQHSKGQAVDFRCPGYGTIQRIAQAIMLNKDTIQYDQLILEPTWIHISFVSDKVPRGNELTYTGPGAYSKGIKVD